MSEQDIYELLAGGMVLVAISYVIYFFADYIRNGPQDPDKPDGFV